MSEVRSCVIVGHGRAHIGKGFGPRIDDCAFVIRMWDWQWQNEPDWGKKYSYGLIELETLAFRLFKEHNERNPTLGWIASRRPGWVIPALPDRTTLIESDKWERVGKAMGAKGETGDFRLTRGMVAACWALDLGIDQLILLGFDSVYEGKCLSIKDGYPEEYVNLASTYPWRTYDANAGKTVYGNHDYANEGPLLEKLCKDQGVELKFSQDLWK